MSGAGGGRDADVLCAGAGGELLGRAEAENLEAQREAVGGERRGGDGDAEFVAGMERAQVVAFAAGDGDDDGVGGEKCFQVEAGGGEGLLVGLVADGEGAGEEDHAGGVGVGEADGAGVGEGHGGEFGILFFDSNQRG